MEAVSPELIAEARNDVCPPERSLLVASLLTMSGGFLDASTWLTLGGVFSSSQTGNVVFLGVYAMSGQWQQAAHHLLPIAAFLLGAWLAIRIRAPLLSLAGEIACLAAVMLLRHRIPDMVAIFGMSFGAALQSASFRQIERWNYLSITVTGNMLRAIDQSVATSDRDATRGCVVMLLLCLLFLSGAAIGSCVAKWFGGRGLLVPIGLSLCVLWLCRRRR
ncbi:YoaK family protein [Bradyrhizobium retamae]|nr:YoaK family protein [Bradyrhizobium retamae]